MSVEFVLSRCVTPPCTPRFQWPNRNRDETTALRCRNDGTKTFNEPSWRHSVSELG